MKKNSIGTERKNNMEQQKLGRGLAAIFGDESESQSETEPIGMVDIDLIVPNADQPRKFFDEEKILELKNSIVQHGILQPLAVRKNGNNYEIIAGERRWRAAKLAGLKQVPVNIVSCDDNQALTMSLVENIQRADLNPIEEAEAMRTIMQSSGCTQNDLANMIDKSRSYVTNSLRLLSLPDKIQDLIKIGRLSAGHGKVLAGLQNPNEIAELAMENNWNVRQLESSVRKMQNKESNSETPLTTVDVSEESEIAHRISQSLNLETQLKITKNGGVIKIICKSCEALESLTEKLISLGN